MKDYHLEKIRESLKCIRSFPGHLDSIGVRCGVLCWECVYMCMSVYLIYLTRMPYQSLTPTLIFTL